MILAAPLVSVSVVFVFLVIGTLFVEHYSLSGYLKGGYECTKLACAIGLVVVFTLFACGVAAELSLYVAHLTDKL